MSVKETFRYPHPVNEVTARLIAGMVALLGEAILAFDLPWLLPERSPGARPRRPLQRSSTGGG